MTERVERWSRGLASLALLVGLVVGVPAALIVLGGDPVPREWDPAGLWAALLRPDDGTVLVRLLTLVGWLAWLVFTLSLLVELVNLVRRRASDVVLPGLGGVQQWAAGLMLAVVALGGAAQLTSGLDPPTSLVARAVPGPDAAARATPEGPEAPRTTAASARAAGPAAAQEEADAGPAVTEAVAVAPAPSGRRERVHVVETGDDLWSLAEHYYGRGQEWRRIAAANPDRLTGGPDRLEVGWRLVVPDTIDRDAASGGQRDGEASVRVRHGDSLTSIAERALGDADRWNELYRANRDQLSDPDELPVGLSLRRRDGPPARPAPPRTRRCAGAPARAGRRTPTTRPPHRRRPHPRPPRRGRPRPSRLRLRRRARRTRARRLRPRRLRPRPPRGPRRRPMPPGTERPWRFLVWRRSADCWRPRSSVGLRRVAAGSSSVVRSGAGSRTRRRRPGRWRWRWRARLDRSGSGRSTGRAVPSRRPASRPGSPCRHCGRRPSPRSGSSSRWCVRRLPRRVASSTPAGRGASPPRTWTGSVPSAAPARRPARGRCW